MQCRDRLFKAVQATLPEIEIKKDNEKEFVKSPHYNKAEVARERNLLKNLKDVEHLITDSPSSPLRVIEESEDEEEVEISSVLMRMS